jgi:flagellar hook-basal body complex protein FliE
MGGNGGRAVAAGLGAANSASLGTLDRAVGYADWLIPGGVKPWNDTPERSVKRAQKTRQTLRELHPASSTTGEIAGFMAPGGAVYQGGMKLGAKLPQLSGKAAPYMARLAGLAGLGGAENAVFQSTVGASNQEAETGQRVGLPERGQMAVEGGTNPIALAAGPAASLAYRGGRGLMTGKVTPKFLQPTANAPTVSAIRDMKNEAYKASDAIDVTYTADGIQNLVAGIENKLQSLNVDPILHPRASRTLKRMQDRVGRDMSLQELENIRRFTRRDVIDSGAAGGIPGANDAEKMLGSVIMDEIDGFIGAGKDVAKGDGLAAADAITNARRLNTVYRKSQKLEDAVEKASNRAATTGSGGNFENALRQEIKKVYEHQKLASGFNKAEKEAMKKVIDGGPTQNLLRNIGKLSPQGNGLMSMLGMFGLAGSYTNPLLAVPPVAGFVAKRMAEKGIKNKFDDLDALVRSGANQPPMKNITPPKAPGGTVPAGLPKKGGMKDKAIDAAALGLVTAGSAGSADAQAMSVDDRIYNQEKSLLALEDERANVKNDLAVLNDPDAAVEDVQRILQRRVNSQLQIDGSWGPQTEDAANTLKLDLAEQLKANSAEIESAQNQMGNLRIAAADERQSKGGLVSQLQSKAPLAALVAGGMLGMRSRGGAVRQSKKDALAMEQRANRLIDPNSPVRGDFTQNQDARGLLQKINPVDSPADAQRADELAFQEAMQDLPLRKPPNYTSGINGINNRANSVIEFERLGGAKPGQRTFKEKSDGDFIANSPKNVIDPSKLFRGATIPGTPIPNPYKLKDVGIMGSFGGEALYSSTLLEKEKVKIEDARERMEAARDKNDDVAYDAALKDLREAEAMATVYDATMRLGLGIAGARGFAGLKQPYARPQPNMRNARREAGLIKESISKKKRKPPGSANPD